MTVNVDVVNQWADALESGRYRQGRSYLRDENDCFCCLGVLCELAVQAGVITEPEWRTCVGVGGCYYYYGEDSSALPPPVQEWAGLVCDPDFTVLVDGRKVDTTAIGLNDRLGWTFPQIASVIRRQYGAV